MKLTRTLIFILMVCWLTALPAYPFSKEKPQEKGKRIIPAPLPTDLARIKSDLIADDLKILKIKVLKEPYLFRLTLQRGERIFKAKWKVLGENGDEMQKFKGNNAPRCETAAYWFNEAIWGDKSTDLHLVPPVVVRAFHINIPACDRACKHLPRFNKVYQFGSFPEINDHVVIGALSYWLEGVTFLENFTTGKKPYFFDQQRFKESAPYRRSFSDTNLFTYLVQHRDINNVRNLLITSPDYQRIFLVDNGHTFDGHKFRYHRTWYGFRHFYTDDFSAREFSRDTVERIKKINLKKLRSRLRITSLINLDTGETILEPPHEFTGNPLSINRHFKKLHKGVYTGYWKQHNWAAWGIEENGIGTLMTRIAKVKQIMGKKYPLFP